VRFVAVRGSTLRRAAARPAAAGTPRASGTASSVFVWFIGGGSREEHRRRRSCVSWRFVVRLIDVLPRVQPLRDRPLLPRLRPRFSGGSSKGEDVKDEERAFRGGSWCYASSVCRASFRLWSPPVFRCRSLGFRVVLSSPQDRFPSAISPSNSLPLSSPEKK